MYKEKQRNVVASCMYHLKEMSSHHVCITSKKWRRIMYVSPQRNGVASCMYHLKEMSSHHVCITSKKWRRIMYVSPQRNGVASCMYHLKEMSSHHVCITSKKCRRIMYVPPQILMSFNIFLFSKNIHNLISVSFQKGGNTNAESKEDAYNYYQDAMKIIDTLTEV